MKLKYTPEAIADLQNTKAYILNVLRNPNAATRITKQILDMCGSLKEHPNLGMSLKAKTDIETDLKYFICENHLAFYCVDGDWVMVVRILDGRTDYMHMIFK